MSDLRPEFSFKTRADALDRFGREHFDLLVIGGGITGAATARDAASRGLKVALVEMGDYAQGTSSRSSKLIHGGLRYLENMEFALVFEALAERSFLLRTTPHMVRPLAFYFPIYKTDKKGMGLISIGMWLYDLLALFRTPGFHRRLSRKEFLKEIPFLKHEGLKGGFQYYDASMWDDGLVHQTLRSASRWNLSAANYCEAIEPLWDGQKRIAGFKVKDRSEWTSRGEIEIRATRTILCLGPWADRLGPKLAPSPEQPWKPWLSPSKGVHLVFDRTHLPVPGALVMSHPDDGRISFVIPRPDFGAGVTIVGTTDGPVGTSDPLAAKVEPSDVDYLMRLLDRYFPNLRLKREHIVSSYVGVRPLVGGDAASLQKVSREHSIELGPGGVTLVGGGKYTTHRKMAEEIVDFTLKHWDEEAAQKSPNDAWIESRTDVPINPEILPDRVSRFKAELRLRGDEISYRLVDLYGTEAREIVALEREVRNDPAIGLPSDPAGFPCVAGQLRFAIRTGSVLHLEDFYLRRVPLYLARADHGMPWALGLARVLVNDLEIPGLSAEQKEKLAQDEVIRLEREIARRRI